MKLRGPYRKFPVWRLICIRCLINNFCHLFIHRSLVPLPTTLAPMGQHLLYTWHCLRERDI